MQCPVGDGELIAHTTSGENNLTVTYSTCPACRGYWMESFAANFIKLTPTDPDTGAPAATSADMHCPVCGDTLVRATGDNIPDTVWVYTCRTGHGYFFPAGQLAAFKKAQKTKIEYHRLWNLPLPGVKSVLLGIVVAVVLAGGFIAATVGLQSTQTTSSQAQGLIASQHAYVNTTTQDVLISATTAYDAAVTIHIDAMNNFSAKMETKNGRTHTITVKHVPQGFYEYYFTVKYGSDEVQTPNYSFVIPG